MKANFSLSILILGIMCLELNESKNYGSSSFMKFQHHLVNSEENQIHPNQEMIPVRRNNILDGLKLSDQAFSEVNRYFKTHLMKKGLKKLLKKVMLKFKFLKKVFQHQLRENHLGKDMRPKNNLKSEIEIEKQILSKTSNYINKMLDIKFKEMEKRITKNFRLAPQKVQNPQRMSFKAKSSTISTIRKLPSKHLSKIAQNTAPLESQQTSKIVVNKTPSVEKDIPLPKDNPRSNLKLSMMNSTIAQDYDINKLKFNPELLKQISLSFPDGPIKSRYD